MSKKFLYYKAINWNEIEDELDNATWERATSLFWLDNRIPIENDKPAFNRLSAEERQELNRSLIFLANLSTYQSLEAEEFIRHSERSQQEVAIVNNLQFTEMVNTKAYNTILYSFNEDEQEVASLFEWVDQHKLVVERLERVDTVYHSKNAIQKRFMATCVEGIMTYSQLAFLMKLWIQKDFTNLGEMVKMILLNESLHCDYLIHKVNLLLAGMDRASQISFQTWAVEMIEQILKTERKIIHELYVDADIQKLARNLVQREANRLLESIEVEERYPVDREILSTLDRVLNRLRKHELLGQMSTHRIEESHDDDYDF